MTAPLEPLSPAFHKAVVERIRASVEAAGVDGMLVLDTPNVVYATGFFHSANERPMGLWVPRRGAPSLLVPLLELENAAATWISDVRTYEEFPGEVHPVRWMVASVGARRLMVDTLSAAVHQALARDVDAIVLTDLVERLRAVKGPAELALVRAAARYADAVLDAIRARTADIVRGGGTELDILSAGLSAAAAMQKAELGPAFGHTKVGLTGTVHTGPRAALPHGKVIARRPDPGDTMIAGIGASVGGYHAESGITLILGEPTADQRHCLTAAAAANDAAVAALRPGTPCRAVNDAALAELRAAGLGDAIRHRIGHAMGVQGHEGPWLAPGDDTPVAVGMVFSNEPGIYRPGIDGYRTINTMIVTETGVEVPSTFQARHPLDARVVPL
ncbi:MAG: M24 family metallopeptidase [Rhodospirillales bacterium]